MDRSILTRSANISVCQLAGTAVWTQLQVGPRTDYGVISERRCATRHRMDALCALKALKDDKIKSIAQPKAKWRLPPPRPAPDRTSKFKLEPDREPLRSLRVVANAGASVQWTPYLTRSSCAFQRTRGVPGRTRVCQGATGSSAEAVGRRYACTPFVRRCSDSPKST